MAQRLAMRRAAMTLLMAAGLVLDGALVTLRPASASSSTVYYLALGDSVPVWNGTNSYPYLIASHYSVPGLQVEDMAVSGETTSSMLNDGQMYKALSFLQQHAGATVLITIDIGGNDLLPCVNGTSVNLACLQGDESTAVSNLGIILSQLRQAAGPTAPIIGMNYFDPFLGDWLAGGSTQTEADLSVSLVGEFNSMLTGAYQQVGAPVADVASAFDITDLTDMVSSQWGDVPLAVDKACTLLDITCQAGQMEGFGDDPTEAGATVIAQAFEQTIGSTITPLTSTTTTSASAPSTTSPPTTSPPTTSSTRAVSAGSLAFTGTGSGLSWLALAALVLASAGGCLWLADEVRTRLGRRSS